MASSGLEQIVPDARINSPNIFAPLQNENPESEPSRALFHTVQNFDYLLRDAVPTNEFGIVIPPHPTECIGIDCKFCGGESPCELSRHHLHSSASFYEQAGEVAQQFRKLNALTVWLPQCQHDIHHKKHEIVVPIPSLDVMQQCIEEARILANITYNQKVHLNTERELEHPDIQISEKKGLRRFRAKLQVRQKELLEEVKTIEVIPEEIVTGALLFAAPNHARSKLIKYRHRLKMSQMELLEETKTLEFNREENVVGSGYGLTGTMDKDYVLQAIAVVNLALQKNSLTAAA